MDNQNETMATEQVVSSSGFDSDKTLGIIAYFVFFIPFIFSKKSNFARFHGNQGLNVLLFSVAVNVVGTFMFLLSWLILPIGNLMVFVFIIIGIINVSQGRTQKLPLIGEWNLLGVE
ncbi:hypothetical protein CO180_02520 [candidate division WWE3 bacterium CG_4_9_14_3_um_filter_41_6]|uniref:DUF4870 domain-containing protein n=1 Tax=candidate division WWE3 bacterium CG_4_10_14_0_2_um_filter_41_14 TaxID=1975072 RepID=A0A2M7TJN4_UNCKA|nr:MAG: hypothetical protein COY32_02695 [candidate division WWE3 bacterium CG_4_10_14_0_2_um_filter_41_14]PJA38772.1 MAG: hypothetical protein CO180_02520 [candidate division WWE3 bacterium CG_4_9_14_3_um_filter_41_6]